MEHVMHVPMTHNYHVAACQAVLEDLGRVLLSHSVHVPGKLGDITEVPDLGTLLDTYGNTALDFIVDVGPRIATASSVSAKLLCCCKMVLHAANAVLGGHTLHCHSVHIRLAAFSSDGVVLNVLALCFSHRSLT